MITYHKPRPWPNCKFCGKEMDYWIPGQPDSEASHDECYIKNAVDESLKIFSDEFKKNISKRKAREKYNI